MDLMLSHMCISKGPSLDNNRSCPIYFNEYFVNFVSFLKYSFVSGFFFGYGRIEENIFCMKFVRLVMNILSKITKKKTSDLV